MQQKFRHKDAEMSLNCLQEADQTMPIYRDLTQLPFVTIDDASAQDLDDAVYAQQLDTDRFKLSVAIADVAAFVTPESAMDKLAKKRGNSVYLPAETLHMLPRFLAQDLCSLQPLQNRQAVVCEMVLDASGQVYETQVFLALIKSHGKLTYAQVEDYFSALDTSLFDDSAVIANLNVLFRLQAILDAQALNRHQLKFAFERRVEVHCNADQLSLTRPASLSTHKLIEGCMILTNHTLAKWFAARNLIAISRYHAEPMPTDCEQLQRQLYLHGIMTPASLQQRASWNQALQNELSSHAIQLMMLQTLPRAVYSDCQQGHFGIGLDHYVHFTSPIRRYADLYNHQLLRSILIKTLTPPSQTDLTTTCRWISNTERRADQAAKFVANWMKCMLLVGAQQTSFSATVMRINTKYLTLNLDQYDLTGRLCLNRQQRDRMNQQRTKVALTQAQEVQIGDQLMVKTIAINMDQQQIDLVLA